MSLLGAFIITSRVKFDGRQRELKSRLTNSKRQTSEKCESDIKKPKESNTCFKNARIVWKSK